MRNEGIMSFLNRIADFVILSTLWCVFSLPLITIGASTAALYHTTIKVIRQDRGYVFSTFLNSFKQNFRSTLLPTLIFGGALAVSGVTCYYFWEDTESLFSNSYVMFSMFCIVLLLLAMFHTFAAIGRFNLSRAELITVVTRMIFGHLMMNILIICLFIAAVQLVFIYIPLIFFIVPSALFFLLSLLEEPAFKKHIRFEDDWNTDILHNENMPFAKKDGEETADTASDDGRTVD